MADGKGFMQGPNGIMDLFWCAAAVVVIVLVVSVVMA